MGQNFKMRLLTTNSFTLLLVATYNEHLGKAWVLGHRPATTNNRRWHTQLVDSKVALAETTTYCLLTNMTTAN